MQASSMGHCWDRVLETPTARTPGLAGGANAVLTWSWGFWGRGLHGVQKGRAGEHQAQDTGTVTRETAAWSLPLGEGGWQGALHLGWLGSFPWQAKLYGAELEGSGQRHPGCDAFAWH